MLTFAKLLVIHIVSLCRNGAGNQRSLYRKGPARREKKEQREYEESAEPPSQRRSNILASVELFRRQRSKTYEQKGRMILLFVGRPKRRLVYCRWKLAG